MKKISANELSRIQGGVSGAGCFAAGFAGVASIVVPGGDLIGRASGLYSYIGACWNS